MTRSSIFFLLWTIVAGISHADEPGKVPGLTVTEYPRHAEQVDEASFYVDPGKLVDPIGPSKLTKSLDPWTWTAERNAIARGELIIPDDGDYAFVADSHYDRNVLMIEGKVVCGFRDGTDRVATIPLKKGPVEICVVGYVGSRGSAKVLWRPPGHKELGPIPSHALRTKGVHAAPRKGVLVVAKDFVVEVYHNGTRVPDEKREYLLDRFGASAECIDVPLQAGDWIVFHVANNRLRHEGRMYFAMAASNGADRFAHVSDHASPQWSSCDDPGRARDFIKGRHEGTESRAVPITKVWEEGDKYMTEFSGATFPGAPLWGAAPSCWIKYVVPGPEKKPTTKSREKPSSSELEKIVPLESKRAKTPVKASGTAAVAKVNSLGMKFLPVPGTEVLMCIHETRKGDYATYAAEHPQVHQTWKTIEAYGFPVSENADHPVVNVNWNDAAAFCKWLSEKEGLTYRLPTDREWSLAVGIGAQEPKGMPERLDGAIKGIYPWGTQWPPPRGAGNFADSAGAAKIPGLNAIPGYEDGYATTAPVMSFEANQSGFYDLSGNVWEWCEDWYDKDRRERVLRGGAWQYDELSLLSSDRLCNLPETRDIYRGFRCVLDPSGRKEKKKVAHEESKTRSILAVELPRRWTVQVLAATYGTGGKNADVTERVTRFVEERKRFSANPVDLGADPNPGWNKGLHIVYLKEGVRREQWWNENGTVLPDSLYGPQDAGELTRWLEGTRWTGPKGEIQFHPSGLIAGSKLSGDSQWKALDSRKVRVTWTNEESLDYEFDYVWSEFKRPEDGKDGYRLIK